jgi:integrase
MATVYRKRPGDIKWCFAYTDENGRRVVKVWSTDYNETVAEAARREKQVELIKLGYLKREEVGPAEADKKPLAGHLADWKAAILAKGNTAKHARIFTMRTQRLLSEAGISRLSDLTAETVQKALAALGKPESGRKALAKGTLNVYRTAVKSFSAWLKQTGRMRDNPLRTVAGFNAKKDPRHDRRTLGPEELRALVQAAQNGAAYGPMTGPARALLYRTVFSTGLRFNEIKSATTHSFSLEASAPTVRVAAAYTKNGNEAVQPLPLDVAADLHPWLAAREPGAPAFDLPFDDGARMLRRDLKAAGVPYKDAAGRVFDFHSLRAQYATELDRQGVPPRVIQMLMRHSNLEDTMRYMRPRAVDLERAVATLPSFRPTVSSEPQTMRATGTYDGRAPRAHESAAKTAATRHKTELTLVGSEGSEVAHRRSLETPLGGSDQPSGRLGYRKR